MPPREIIFIEGNVAAGKTTALNHIRHRTSALVIEEPVRVWQNVPAKPESLNLLGHFYQDLKKYGFCFQTYAFLSRMKLLLEAFQTNPNTSTIICERSIFTDREVFLESLTDAGLVTSMEQATYHALWDFWISLMRPYFQGIKVRFLYLNCPPEKALEHVVQRARQEEKEINIDYLTSLDQRHRRLYLDSANGTLTKLVQTLTGSSEPVPVEALDNLSTRDDYLKELDHFFGLN
jgi:deoxyadenosine/deoxycytidine kinase